MASSFNFSIKWLLALILAIAFLATGLANASIIWASLSLTLAFFGLLFGVLGLIFRRNEKRAYWIGFVLFGFAYAVAMYAPGFDRVLGQRLVTTKILGYLEPVIRRTDASALNSVLGMSAAHVATDPVQEAVLRWVPQWDHFQQVGHSTFAIMLACIGGGLAHRLYLSTASAKAESTSTDGG